MNLFKTFTLTWWQTSFFKVGMGAAGIAVGAYWHEFFGNYLLILHSGCCDLSELRYLCVGEAINGGRQDGQGNDRF